VFGLLVPTILALAVALCCGGSPLHLVEARFRGWPVIALGFGLELALYNPPLDHTAWAMAIGPWVWMAVRVAFVTVLVMNGFGRAAWAWRLAALGVALNTLVIALNGGHMPQSPEAAAAVWGASQIDADRLQNVSVMGPATRLAWLGDVFAEPAWLPRRNVVSMGDIFLAIGVAGWAYSAMRPRTTPIALTKTAIASASARRVDGAAGGAHQSPAG
jgi:hypothetical protein